MLTTLDEQRTVATAATPDDLEAPLSALEERLRAMTHSLQRSDAEALDRVAGDLHAALAAAVDRFQRAARHGAITPVLRQRLATASAQVAAQREALARATASLDRAIDVLMPRTRPAPLYSNAGTTERGLSQGGVVA